MVSALKYSSYFNKLDKYLIDFLKKYDNNFKILKFLELVIISLTGMGFFELLFKILLHKI